MELALSPQAWAAYAALAFMAFDMVTGFLGAVKEKVVDSTRIRMGLFHKSAIVLVMALAWMLEFFVEKVPTLDFPAPVFVPVCCMIVFMELVSNLENIAVINPELKGSKLLELLERDKPQGKHVKAAVEEEGRADA